MDIDCFIYEGWRPRLRAASARRGWMDETPESFAYRCLPLAIANAHGWEIANAVGFCARWTGGSGVEAVEIRLDDEDGIAIERPVSLFGQGTITFHIAGLFRTPPGWNLWIGGAPNDAKDGIAALSAVVETDWSPYSFTMNWRFTRPNQWVRFEAGETICFFFPVQRGVVEAVRPRVRSISEAPDLQHQFEEWSRSRDAFQAMVDETPSLPPAQKWQKLYYRGVCPAGATNTLGHQTRIRAVDFADQPAGVPAYRPPAPARPITDPQIERRDWLLGVQEELRELSPRLVGLPRLEQVETAHFLDHHYAMNRPVLLSGMMTGWPALALWSPNYLAAQIGGAMIECQAGRTTDPCFKIENAHQRAMSFDQFIAQASAPDASNNLHLTTYTSSANRDALTPLHHDLGRIDPLLEHGPANDEAMFWIGGAGRVTQLHHGLANNLLAQIVGRKRVLLIPPSEANRLDREAIVSSLGDLLDPTIRECHPDLHDLRIYDIVLEPGTLLFIPVGWWHQVTALEFCVSAAYTNFRWRNDWRCGLFDSSA